MPTYEERKVSKKKVYEAQTPCEKCGNRSRNKQGNCKICQKEWRDNHPDYQKKYGHKINNETRLLHSAKARAKEKNRDFSLKVQDIIIPAFCPLLGIPIFRGKGTLAPNSPTLDRIDSAGGYTPDNVWVISHRANTLKNNSTLDELSLLAYNWGRLTRP